MLNLTFIGDLTLDNYKTLNQVKLGGASLNQAVWAKRLGQEPTIMAAVGDGDLGKKYLDFLKKENINCLVKQIKGKTSQIEIFLDENGERRWGKWAVGVMRDYHLGDEEKDFLLTQDAVCLPVYFPIRHLLAEVSSHISHFPHPLLVADFDDLSQFQKKTAFLEKHLPFLDLVFLGLDKQNDKKLIQQLKKLSKEFQRTIIVTLNAQGSVCFANDQEERQTAQKIKAVDTTGGGDAFLVGFVIEYLKTKNISIALQKGTSLATKAITRMGAY
ncbi:hypothetical protein HY345_04465 [Candidatus Microgenomates bacterium]|nr:hypothetical protein [Candidatus Microgenomates bacterium]